MLDIAKRLSDTQLILVCGHNARAGGSASGLARAGAPRVVLGFTPDIARYMQLVDFLIGKPGPGSLSEAVQMRLPVIVVCNRWTLPQERYNAQWVREKGVGLVCPSFVGIAGAVAELLGNIATYRDATAQVSNRALFELPLILQEILDRSVSIQPVCRWPERADQLDRWRLAG